MSQARDLSRSYFIISTALLILLGAFSRFTHGHYTPRYYAYQEYHQPDDGSTAAKIVPVMDTILGVMLLVKKTRSYAAIVVAMFMVFGLLVQINAGKRCEIDLFMIAIATGAVIQARAFDRRS